MPMYSLVFETKRFEMRDVDLQNLDKLFPGWNHIVVIVGRGRPLRGAPAWRNRIARLKIVLS
jgi:hypothetical protein